MLQYNVKSIMLQHRAKTKQRRATLHSAHVYGTEDSDADHHPISDMVPSAFNLHFAESIECLSKSLPCIQPCKHVQCLWFFVLMDTEQNIVCTKEAVP